MSQAKRAPGGITHGGFGTDSSDDETSPAASGSTQFRGSSRTRAPLSRATLSSSSSSSSSASSASSLPDFVEEEIADGFCLPSRAKVPQVSDVVTLDCFVEELKKIEKRAPKANGNVKQLDYRRMLSAVALWLESKQDSVDKWDQLFGNKAGKIRTSLGWTEIKNHYWLSEKWNTGDQFMTDYYNASGVPWEDFNKNWYNGTPANIGRYFSTACYAGLMKVFVYMLYCALMGNGRICKLLPKNLETDAKEFMQVLGSRWTNARLRLPQFMKNLSFTNGTSYEEEREIDKQAADYLSKMKLAKSNVKKRHGGPSQAEIPSSSTSGYGESMVLEQPQTSKRVAFVETEEDVEEEIDQVENLDDEIKEAVELVVPPPLFRASCVIEREIAEMQAILTTKEDERSVHNHIIAKLRNEIQDLDNKIEDLNHNQGYSLTNEQVDSYFASVYGQDGGKQITSTIKNALTNFVLNRDGGAFVSQVAAAIGIPPATSITSAYAYSVLIKEGKVDIAENPQVTLPSEADLSTNGDESNLENQNVVETETHDDIETENPERMGEPGQTSTHFTQYGEVSFDSGDLRQLSNGTVCAGQAEMNLGDQHQQPIFGSGAILQGFADLAGRNQECVNSGHFGHVEYVESVVVEDEIVDSNENQNENVDSANPDPDQDKGESGTTNVDEGNHMELEGLPQADLASTMISSNVDTAIYDHPAEQEGRRDSDEFVGQFVSSTCLADDGSNPLNKEKAPSSEKVPTTMMSQHECGLSTIDSQQVPGGEQTMHADESVTQQQEDVQMAEPEGKGDPSVAKKRHKSIAEQASNTPTRKSSRGVVPPKRFGVTDGNETVVEKGSVGGKSKKKKTG